MCQKLQKLRNLLRCFSICFKNFSLFRLAMAKLWSVPDYHNVRLVWKWFINNFLLANNKFFICNIYFPFICFRFDMIKYNCCWKVNFSKCLEFKCEIFTGLNNSCHFAQWLLLGTLVQKVFVTKNYICLKYFLDKNSHKQPLCLVNGIINLVKSLMCQISNPTFILEEFSRIDNRFVSLLKFSVAAVILLFFQWKFGKMVFRGTMGANLSWIITFNWIGILFLYIKS